MGYTEGVVARLAYTLFTKGVLTWVEFCGTLDAKPEDLFDSLVALAERDHELAHDDAVAKLIAAGASREG